MTVTVLLGNILREPAVVDLMRHFDVKRAKTADDLLAMPEADRAAIRGVAEGFGFKATRAVMDALPNLEIIAHVGVGYDGADTDSAAEKGIVYTNTPGVLDAEVADTTLGLLLMTVRSLSASERYLRAGKWPTDGAFPLSDSLRGRTVGIAGYGRIGAAVARRLEAFGLPIVYHNRNPKPDVAYRYYPSLVEMARDVDTLVSILPGGAATRHLIDADVLAALGPRGIFVNVGRGTAVDEAALVRALYDRTILAAGLDVFEKEPHVPDELMALDNAVLLPHVGSASVATRNAMSQLVVDNLKNWFDKGAPLTPVPETPWPR